MWIANKNLPSFWKLNYRWLKDGRLIFILILKTRLVWWIKNKDIIPVDTRHRFNVYKTSYRHLVDVETTSCVYWDYIRIRYSSLLLMSRTPPGTLKSRGGLTTTCLKLMKLEVLMSWLILWHIYVSGWKIKLRRTFKQLCWKT